MNQLVINHLRYYSNMIKISEYCILIIIISDNNNDNIYKTQKITKNGQ